jgi:signal transduction histidine kinase
LNPPARAARPVDLRRRRRPRHPRGRIATLLLQRGVRGDERVQGHGIGLAIVQDIVKSYRGQLAVEHSPELGGARFHVRFEATR